jgi:hypothetical protein
MPSSARWSSRLTTTSGNSSRARANNEFDDLWVDAGAIMALKLAATPRSAAILEDVKQKNPGAQVWSTVRSIT